MGLKTGRLVESLFVRHLPSDFHIAVVLLLSKSQQSIGGLFSENGNVEIPWTAGHKS